MGRLSKIKSRLIEQANKRLLNEYVNTGEERRDGLTKEITNKLRGKTIKLKKPYTLTTSDGEKVLLEKITFDTNFIEVFNENEVYKQDFRINASVNGHIGTIDLMPKRYRGDNLIIHFINYDFDPYTDTKTPLKLKSASFDRSDNTEHGGSTAIEETDISDAIDIDMLGGLEFYTTISNKYAISLG